MSNAGSGGMFPKRLRKRPASLLELCQRKVFSWTYNFVRDCQAYSRHREAVSAYLSHELRIPPDCQSELLAILIPAKSGESRWRFQCLDEGKTRVKCTAHKECKLVYANCDRILGLYLTNQVTRLRLDLKRLELTSEADLPKKVIREVIRAFNVEGETCPNLTRVDICGGNVIHSDTLIEEIEDLCHILARKAANLKELRLPVFSNRAAFAVAKMKRLQSFKCDRTKHFTHRGLDSLINGAESLQSVHLGLFKHKLFNKLDALKFLDKRRDLKGFSLMEEDRLLVSFGGGNSLGGKVFTYSALKLAILGLPDNTNRDTDFKCGLKSVKIVDRELKPKYLLHSCPDLTGLYVDWQEELSLPPFRNFARNWFSAMLETAEWPQLAAKLTDLQIAFPAAYLNSHYALPMKDWSKFFAPLSKLTRLKLTGAGRESPLPLDHVLTALPELVELDLDRSGIHVPGNWDSVESRFVHKALKAFRFTGDMTSLLLNAFLTRFLAFYAPNLEEVELQPESAVGYPGMTPGQMRELSDLHALSRLSLPLATTECVMNMPELIYVLREFKCLRYLVLSWGRASNAYDVNTKTIMNLMNWLFNALGAENADIHLQLSYKLHPDMFVKRRN